jgi:isochorismate synthase
LQPDLQLNAGQITNEIIQKLSACTEFSEYSFPENTSETTIEDDFCQQVSEAVEAIQKGNLFKVILSKTRTENKTPEFLPEKLFGDLCDAYPHALVYYWQIPGAGSWMGATPEPVLREKNGQIYTVSLAGTQLLNNQSLSEVCWREKEIAEQAIVSRFIVQLIDKLGVEKFNIIGPHNFQAGNLVHLNTGFEFDAAQLLIPRGEFIAALHPTPSIAGLPRDKAMQFIQMHELHSRSYYAGLLGPYRLQDETHLYVNLRCMQLFEDEFVLYSGAGITGSSVPEREWEETDNKMMTLLKVIHA